MPHTDELLANNRAWAGAIRASNPGFFERLAAGQQPRHYWIGCSDSRVPVDVITGAVPGDLFVHRNIANLVQASDANGMAALEFAITVLRVEAVIICGHTGCGGMAAALRPAGDSTIDRWVQPVRDHAREAEPRFHPEWNDTQRADCLARVNVLAQVVNLTRTPVVRDAWSQHRKLLIHGWIYDVRDGLIKNLGPTISSADMVEERYQRAVDAQFEGGSPG